MHIYTTTKKQKQKNKKYKLVAERKREIGGFIVSKREDC